MHAVIASSESSDSRIRPSIRVRRAAAPSGNSCPLRRFSSRVRAGTLPTTRRSLPTAAKRLNRRARRGATAPRHRLRVHRVRAVAAVVRVARAARAAPATPAALVQGLNPSSRAASGGQRALLRRSWSSRCLLLYRSRILAALLRLSSRAASCTPGGILAALPAVGRFRSRP
jgi:hypothetical protein